MFGPGYLPGPLFAWPSPPGETPRRNEVELAVDLKNAGLDAIAASLYRLHVAKTTMGAQGSGYAGSGAGGAGGCPTPADLRFDFLRASVTYWSRVFASMYQNPFCLPGASSSPPVPVSPPWTKLQLLVKKAEPASQIFCVNNHGHVELEIEVYCQWFEPSIAVKAYVDGGNNKLAPYSARNIKVEARTDAPKPGTYNGFILVTTTSKLPIHVEVVSVTAA